MNATEKLQLTFDSIWNSISEALPTFLMGVVILIGGWLIAKLVSKLVRKLLSKTGDSKIAKYLSLEELSNRLNMDIDLSLVISKVVYWIILLVFIIGATETFGWHNVSVEISNFMKYLPKFLSAVIIFAFGYTVANLLRNLIKSIAKSTGISFGNFIGDFLFYFLVLIVTITAMSQAGLNTALISSHMYILVGAGAITVSIALGLGSREVVTDLLKNYYNRDVLEEGVMVEYKDIRGKIVQISKTSVVIETDTEKVVVPSKDFYASTYKILKS